MIGMVRATAAFVTRGRRTPSEERYRHYRQSVGRATLLGLEFLLAADLIRTVAIDPTIRSVGVVAIIVAIQAFPGLNLELEIDGH